MINTLSSGSGGEAHGEPPEKPWLDVDFQEPGVHLTDQGLEMTTAWPFPIGSTLRVGISGQSSTLFPAEPEEPGNPAADDTAKVHATGVVVSCEPTLEQGNYQLTIYFLDHLAHMLSSQEFGGDCLDAPGGLDWAGETTAKPQGQPNGSATPSSIFGQGAMVFGLEGAVPKGAISAYQMGTLPFFLGA